MTTIPSENNNPDNLIPKKSRIERILEQHKCECFPCECGLWNAQRSKIYEYLSKAPVSKSDFNNKAWETDPDFWERHHSLNEEEGREPPFCSKRLPARMNELKKILEKSNTPYRVKSIRIPGTHGMKRFFLI